VLASIVSKSIIEMKNEFNMTAPFSTSSNLMVRTLFASGLIERYD